MGAVIQFKSDKHAWDKSGDEPMQWYNRFLHYLRQGSDRDLITTANAFRRRSGKYHGTSAKWAQMATQFDWKARAEAYDQWCALRDQEQFQQARDRVMQSGFAQKHERVKALMDVASMVYGMLSQPDGLFDDVTISINRGKHIELVTNKRFRTGAVKELRGLLSDIALEVGDRTDGAPQQSNICLILPPEEIETFELQPSTIIDAVDGG